MLLANVLMGEFLYGGTEINGVLRGDHGRDGVPRLLKKVETVKQL